MYETFLALSEFMIYRERTDKNMQKLNENNRQDFKGNVSLIAM
jgi:hypothetical protein